MDAKYAIAAYNNAPVPSDLSKEEQAAYTLIKIFYRHFRVGILSQEAASTFKNLVMDWDKCPALEKSRLLLYGIESLWEIGEKNEAHSLMEEYYKLPIGRVIVI